MGASSEAKLASWLKNDYFRMMACASGIMFSLVIYGLLQERIMTRTYDGEQFTSSAYLVLNNRIVAVMIAIVILYWKGEPIKNSAPLSNFGAISLSNTIATFCQYEALRYVSFPTQTLGKCGKMIPVMILGLVFTGKKYGWRDFLIAFLVTIGCVSFVLTGSINDRGNSDSFFGILLMVGYLFSDGFTSTFQERMFKGYTISTYNQMLYVSLCSAIFSLVTLIGTQDLIPSLLFSLNHVEFFFDSLLLSLSSTFGQMVILYTIKSFGALFFATVMTVRQVVSIILSCIIYAHPLSIGQWLSAGLVFGALYYKDTTKTPHHHPAPTAEPKSMSEHLPDLENPEKNEPR